LTFTLETAVRSGNPIAEAFLVRLAEMERGQVLGTAETLTASYGSDADAVVAVLWDLVASGHVERQPGGLFVAGPRARTARHGEE
jgi:hypothetical protein